MYELDFEYDGRLLSSYGFIICQFDGSTGIEVADAGFQMTLNKVKRHHGKKYGLAGITYEDCLQSTFQICKNPETCADPMVTADEYRDIVRWLARPEFLRFRVINEYEYERPTCYYNATFEVKKIFISDRLYGLELTMETDSPFGYGAAFRRTWHLRNNVDVAQFIDMSDEAGVIYPDLEIVCGVSGDYVFQNALTGSRMEIDNCVAGEVIQINGDTMVVTSSVADHKLYDDFNFEFLTVGNTFHERLNAITSSLACDLTLTYRPIIKDIP